MPNSWRRREAKYRNCSGVNKGGRRAGGERRDQRAPMESAALLKMPPLPSSPSAHLHRRSPQSLPLSRTQTQTQTQTLRSRPSFAKTRCITNPYAASSGNRGSMLGGGGGGGGGDGLGGDGGGGGGDGGGEAEVKSYAGESEEVLDLGPDVIVLSVGGMSCGGCAASVKRILESQPQVSSATVDLEKETAFVWVVPEAKVTQNWQQQLGEMFANHLVTCGFKSNLRGQGNAVEGEIQS